MIESYVELKNGGSAMIKLESTVMPQDIRCLFIFMIGGILFILIAEAVKMNGQSQQEIEILRDLK